MVVGSGHTEKSERGEVADAPGGTDGEYVQVEGGRF